MELEDRNSVNEIIKSIESPEQKKVIKSMIRTYENVNGNNKMLETSLIVFVRLNKFIYTLPIKTQLDIIHEATMIAYDARIATFDNILNPDVTNPDVTNPNNLRITNKQ